MAVFLGFVLLFLLLLGAALSVLALVLLGVSAGIQLFVVLAGAGGFAISLATGIQLAAGAAFALGVVLALVGAVALLFPSVRAFARGFAALLRLAANSFQGFLTTLPAILRTVANVQEVGGNILTSTAGPLLNDAGDTLIGAGNSFPEIPTVSPHDEPLWLQTDSQGNRISGYLPKPPLVPDVNIVTGIAIGSAPVTPVVTALTSSGTAVKSAGQNTVEVGQGMLQTASALREMADAIEQVAQ